MTPEEICQRLKPLMGNKIDRLHKLYLLENNKGKKEIEQMLEFLYDKTFKKNYELTHHTTLLPPPSDLTRGEYPLGQISYANKQLYPFGLRENDWIKHVLIVGASGSGKTNLCFQLLNNFLHKKKPFLVFDWKRNYRDILSTKDSKNVRIYTVGREIAPFKFNPLIPPPNTQAKTWVKKLIEMIAHATFCGEGVMYLLQKGLDETYEKFGLYNNAAIEKYPTLHDLQETILNMNVKGRAAGWMSSTVRALGSLTFGESGKVFDYQHDAHMVEILNNPVILELDALTNSDKTFLVESLLLWIHHYRLSSPDGQREKFDHAIILEEAHHIIGKEKSDLVGGEAITDVIIREIRELGESVIIIDQCPSLLSLPARGNTWATFVLNLKDAKDVNSAASALLLEAADKKILGRLKTGQAVTKLQGRWHAPFTITIPYIAIRKGSISDEFLYKYMQSYSTDSGTEKLSNSNIFNIPQNSKQRKIEEEIKTEEVELLKDIKGNPYSGVVERYQRLRWSMRKGNKNKSILIEKNFLAPEVITTRTGKTTILSLTKKAKDFLNKDNDPPEPELRHGGATHEYWKHTYAKIYQDKGYKTILEEPIGNGKSIDLVAYKDNIKIAFEIETGRSDILANINKCLDLNYDHIILVATNNKAKTKIHQILKDNQLTLHPKIKVSYVQDIIHPN